MFGLPNILVTPRSTLRGAWTDAEPASASVTCLSRFSASPRCVSSCRFCKHCIPSSARSWRRSRSGALPEPVAAAAALFGTNGDFAAGLNAWFDDRVGFRDLFIRAKNQIDYTLFDTSKKVWIGSDGWLFDRYPCGHSISTTPSWRSWKTVS